MKPSTIKFMEIKNITMEDIDKMSYQQVCNFVSTRRMLFDIISNCNNVELMRAYLMDNRNMLER